MKAIEIMNEEHKYIIRMLHVIRKCCFKILNGEEVIYEDFDKIIDFVRNYADNHHHKKEEKILFVKMVEELGEPAEKAVKQGMLVEHDLGRLHIRELVEALDKLKAGEEEAKLDVIANAISLPEAIPVYKSSGSLLSLQVFIKLLNSSIIQCWIGIHFSSVSSSGNPNLWGLW